MNTEKISLHGTRLSQTNQEDGKTKWNPKDFEILKNFQIGIRLKLNQYH